MASVRTATSSILSPFYPQFIFSSKVITMGSKTLFSRQLAQPLLPSLVYLSILSGIHLKVPSLRALWDSVLRAVPKKKTSHSKKRSRFLAGKALNDVKALGKCPACGSIKRSHVLCSYCVKGMLFVLLVT